MSAVGLTTEAQRAALNQMVTDYVATGVARLPQMFRGGGPVSGSYTRTLLSPPAPVAVVPDVPVEPDPESPLLAITDSAYLFVDIPGIDLSTSVILTPASYATWDAMFTANSTKRHYLLTPGDYRSWGSIDSYNRVFGSAGNFKTIRYYNPGVDDTLPAIQRFNQARVDGVKITGPNSKYLVVQGLQLKNTVINCGASLEAQWIVFDYNLIEECVTYGLRMNACQNCFVQRNVIRNIVGTSLTADSVGVQFKNADGLPSFSTIDNLLLDNEIYNNGDAYGFTEATTLYQPIEAIVDGNDFYINPSEYVTAAGVYDVNGTRSWHENAGDFKAGSDRAGKNIISNNRAWGFRRNAGPTALGEAWVIQKYCRGLEFFGNITSNCPRGMKDENWPAGTHTLTVDHTTDTYTYANHHFTAGAGPILFKLLSGGTFPGGTDGTTSYWIIVVTSSTFKIATSYANAIAGTAVAVSSNGTGTLQWKLDPAATRNIQFHDNDWCDITDFDVLDIGAVLKPITDISYVDEYIARCSYYTDISPTVYYGPTFTGNTQSELGAIQRPEDQSPVLPYDAGLNTRLGAPVLGYERYERRRWTGPEIATRAKPWIV